MKNKTENIKTLDLNNFKILTLNLNINIIGKIKINKFKNQKLIEKIEININISRYLKNFLSEFLLW